MAKLTLSLKLDENDLDEFYHNLSIEVGMFNYGTIDEIYGAFRTFLVGLGYDATSIQDLME